MENKDLMFNMRNFKKNEITLKRGNDVIQICFSNGNIEIYVNGKLDFRRIGDNFSLDEYKSFASQYLNAQYGVVIEDINLIQSILFDGEYLYSKYIDDNMEYISIIKNNEVVTEFTSDKRIIKKHDDGVDVFEEVDVLSNDNLCLIHISKCNLETHEVVYSLGNKTNNIKDIDYKKIVPLFENSFIMEKSNNIVFSKIKGV